MKLRLTVFIAMILFLTTNVYAELHDRGGGLIYDDFLDVTWLQDANQGNESMWSLAIERADQLEFYDNVRNITWDDWRLPVKGEMAHLYYDEGITYTSQDPFHQILATWPYWTGTAGPPGSNNVWLFDFSNGQQTLGQASIDYAYRKKLYAELSKNEICF